ncbi:MAG TPA: pyridoxamine 5'-phosphate oxidase family protein [Planctomycetaceae bacterium]|nr:pyridoxamine 5'-phosphate oxidase family protein [Planctomycetaceae bacterium]HQZ68568.1 pyridoxamine 5'-phosphate oxidase family protein [Planctomycetaceae bacterium]
MTKPEPAKIDLAELRTLAEKVVAADHFPVLATVDDDQPRLRPVSPVRTDGFHVYVANLRQYHKTIEIERNPKVELCYMDQGHNQVRITGVAKVLQDKNLIQEIWDSNPLLRQYLGTQDNPQLIIYRIEPNRVRYMQEWALEYYEVALP